jgi:hypothetical protein
VITKKAKRRSISNMERTKSGTATDEVVKEPKEI